MKKLIIYGNGSVACATYYMFLYDSSYSVSAFTVDTEYIKDNRLFDLPVLPFEGIETVYPPDEYDMHIAVGHVRVNRIRAEKYRRSKELGYQLVSYISSKAVTWPGLVHGDNCKIGTNATINPFAQLGNNVRIGSGSNVGHHSVIKDHCSLASNVTIAGNVTVEPYCLIGANATIRDRITLAAETVVGAGAVILQDTNPREVYLGRPGELLPISSNDLPIG